MQKVPDEQTFREWIGRDELTVAVFKASWCKDCHFIEPFMPDVEASFSDKIKFIEVDRDELAELCEQLNILGIPSFVAFRRGKELVRFVSKLRKTREEIEQFLSRAVEVSEALSA